MPATPKAKPAKKAPAKPAATAKKTAAPKGVALNPYLIFNGDCMKAFQLYERVFGSKIECLHRMKDMPPSVGKVDAKHRNRVLHLMLPVGSMMLMGADGCPDEPAKVGDNVQLAIRSAFSGTAGTSASDSCGSTRPNGGKPDSRRRPTTCGG